ncbi:type II secretion system secretin GspD [Crenobacter intestini]|uniref:Type II secretion system protein GspD n=1 Tax=Crenobacter intestini TaxID=2563443 RepID=A0A4T0UKA2_9NEIS|nr:type II secretion system secretin GspD [Crenobacter intestini]TIC79069.1 type II secretion system protein GspD [Crenobacter intestini]
MRLAKLAAAFVLAFQMSAHAAPSDPVMLNFVNAEIPAVVQAIGEITGKTFVVDPRVKGTVNIVSAKPVPRDLSYQILLSSLRMQGFAAVEGPGGVVKIVPEADAKLHARSGSPRRTDVDRLITKVFVLRNANANQLVPVLRPIISPNNTVSAMPQGNSVVVTDYADNIRRIESIIESVESAAGGDVAVLPVTFGSAIELSSMLGKLMQAQGEGAGKVTLIPDARANVILVRADTPGVMGKVKSLLRLIDKPSQAGGNVRVVYLKNAEAVQVAKVLRTLLTGEGGGLSAGSGSASQLASASVSGGSSGSSNSGGNLTQGAASGGGKPVAQDDSVSGTGAMVQADPANNALILNVPDAMYQNLRGVIDLLDKRRAQVFVEALIVEVSADRTVELGVQWQAAGKNGFVGTNFPNPGPGILGTALSPSLGSDAQSTALGALANSAGLNIGLIDGTVNIPGIGEILNIGVLARALETQAKGNVLSSPTLMTMDNEQATIVIGQNVPFLTGQYANTGGSNGAANPFQTFERKDVGVKLQLTPQVSEGGMIRLKIFQEASSVDPASLTNPAGLITNTRSIETMVSVRDGNIVALGGLIQETVSNGNSQVPLLGDIPFIGNLFKYKNETRKKSNLMVFLKPTVLRDDEGVVTLSNSRYDYLVGESARVQREKLSLDPATALQAVPAGSLKDALERGRLLRQSAPVQP